MGILEHSIESFRWPLKMQKKQQLKTGNWIPSISMDRWVRVWFSAAQFLSTSEYQWIMNSISSGRHPQFNVYVLFSDALNVNFHVLITEIERRPFFIDDEPFVSKQWRKIVWYLGMLTYTVVGISYQLEDVSNRRSVGGKLIWDGVVKLCGNYRVPWLLS